METQTYNIKCSGCEKVLGESSIENHEGFLCQTCDDEVQLVNALAQGKSYNTSNLASKRPERLLEIIKVALFENPVVLIGLNFDDTLEDSKKEILTKIGLDDLDHEQKVEVLQKIREKGDIANISDRELKDKVSVEKEKLGEKENESI